VPWTDLLAVRRGPKQHRNKSTKTPIRPDYQPYRLPAIFFSECWSALMVSLRNGPCAV
jgi:hypothetical protein